MYQDILNLNKTTKSILKNPDPKSSLAFSNSILRKDPSKANVEGIGLNPNVPLEDEYIQNLQKQIHFMDLEIKLMKEKQAQEEALGGNYQFSKIGLVDGKPPMDHILTTTTKLKSMKIDLTKQITLLEQDLLKMREDNTISTAKVTNLEKHILEYDEKLGRILHENTEALTMLRQKLLVEKRQKDDLETDIHKLKKFLDGVLEENERLRKEHEVREILENLANKSLEDDEKIAKENGEHKDNYIDELQMEKAQLFIVLEKNPRLQSLREENENLHRESKESEKRLDDINYKVLETETRQALSLKKKEEDQEIRKKLQQELEKWKDQLDETIKANELKVERKLREAESPQIKELQAELLKQRHELNELRNKLTAIIVKEREYILDQANRNRYKNDLTKKKETNSELNKQLEAEIKDVDPRANDTEAVVEGLRFKIGDAREEREKLYKKLSEVEEENITLNTKFQFLQNNIRLEEDMKKFNVDDLRNVVEANQNVNETIRDFMTKWDTLKKFSKMP